MSRRPSTTRHPALGLWLALVSAATFGSSGGFAKSLLEAGWTPGAVVTFRIAGAALVLLVPTALSLRGRWSALRHHIGMVTAYGICAVAGCQLAFFNAVQHLSVGVALLLEYLAPVLLVGIAWARTRVRPTRLTTIGVVLSLAGLALVLDLTGATRISLIGVAWGLVAAAGLCVYFLLSADDESGLPPIALAGGGLVVGAVVLGAAAFVGILPMTASGTDVMVGGNRVSWLIPALELVLVAAVTAYVAGIAATRLLGSTVASFVGLTEVLFAVLWAWLLLGELPHLVQGLGGVLIVLGVLAVRVGELRRARLVAAQLAADSDFRMPSSVA